MPFGGSPFTLVAAIVAPDVGKLYTSPLLIAKPKFWDAEMARAVVTPLTPVTATSLLPRVRTATLPSVFWSTNMSLLESCGTATAASTPETPLTAAGGVGPDADPIWRRVPSVFAAYIALTQNAITLGVMRSPVAPVTATGAANEFHETSVPSVFTAYAYDVNP